MSAYLYLQALPKPLGK